MSTVTFEIADGYTERESYIIAQLPQGWEHLGPVEAEHDDVELGDEEPPFKRARPRPQGSRHRAGPRWVCRAA